MHGPKLASAAAWATLTVSTVGQIGLASPVQWIEAEHYESQHGSTASRFTMSTASGGACVDNDWGRQENHFLRYKLNFAPDFLPLHVTLRSTPEPRGMGRNIPGAGLHVKLAGHGPWQRVEQTLASSPVPTVVTHLKWPEVELVQEVFAAAPEEQGFFVRVTLTNKTAAAGEFELVSLLHNAAEAHGAAAEMVYVAPQLQPAEGARKAGKR